MLAGIRLSSQALTAAACFAVSTRFCIVEQPRRPASLCHTEFFDDGTVAFPAVIWIAFVLARPSLQTWTQAGVKRDCSGRPTTEPSEPTRWAPGCQLPELGEPRVSQGMSARDVQLSDAPDGASLVWVIADRYDGDIGSGPVAWIEFDNTGADVEILGTLRAPARDTKLRLDRGWLIARSQRCEVGGCVEVVQLMLHDGEHFETLALELDDGACVVPASFALETSSRVEGPDGDAREHRIERELSIADDGAPRIHERTISQADGEAPDVHERDIRLVLDGRTLRAAPDYPAGYSSQ